jgi:hypothetical protein
MRVGTLAIRVLDGRENCAKTLERKKEKGKRKKKEKDGEGCMITRFGYTEW